MSERGPSYRPVIQSYVYMGDVTNRAIVSNLDLSRAVNAEATVDSQNYRITLNKVDWVIININATYIWQNMDCVILPAVIVKKIEIVMCHECKNIVDGQTYFITLGFWTLSYNMCTVWQAILLFIMQNIYQISYIIY